MKKDDLKAALGKIKPREELINSTLMKMSELREGEKKKSWLYSPAFARGMKLAGALCAFALVFVVGLTVLKDNKTPVVDTPISRTLAEIDTSDSDATGVNIAEFNADDKVPNGWIIVKGDVKSFTISDPDEDEKADGAVHKCFVEFIADNVIERSNTLNVDLAKSSANISADIVFYDEASSNKFAAMTSEKIVIRITPCEDGRWQILDFAVFSD